MPLISVVVPFYNRRNWLEEAINSVLSQTLRDFELILVDDGSTEDISMLKTLHDKRVVLLRQKNKGRSAARNAGVRAAGGKYVAFLDSDDLFLPKKLETQVALMESHPEVLLSHTSYVRMSGDGSLLDRANSGAFCGNVYPDILVECPIATPTVMLRAEAFKTFSFEEKIHVGEDVVLWSRVSRVSSVLGITEPLSLVRIHPDSAAHDAYSQVAGFRNIMKHAAKGDKSLPPFFRSKQLSRVCVFVAWRLLSEGRRMACLACLAGAFFAWPPAALKLNKEWEGPPDFVTTFAACVSPKKYQTRTIRFLKKDRRTFVQVVRSLSHPLLSALVRFKAGLKDKGLWPS
jgi:glycosyltransferase involved in cell wall biosynthesis